jgi:aldose sugar dehydrogenase
VLANPAAAVKLDAMSPILRLLPALLLFSHHSLSAQEPAEPSTAPVQGFRIGSIARGLDDAWAMVRLPDGRILVTQKSGQLRVVDAAGEVSEPVANVPAVLHAGQGGMLDIELHPDYAENGWIYLAFCKPGEKGSLTNIIRARFKDKDHALTDIEPIFEPPAEDYTTGRVHFGCRMEFDEKRFLYFSIGDRGDVTKPQNRAQFLNHVGGKIHRIHDDGKIPEDNPFVKTPGARPSIWSYGNRNPQGLRFQPGTGLLWSTEHGPKGGDELNIIKAGLNYGWPIVTFGINYNGNPITDLTEKEGMEPPVIHWTPSIAVSAIDFYTGDKFPQWKNNLFVGSLAHEKLIRLELDANHQVVKQEIVHEKGGKIRDIRCWDDGFIYVLYSSGKLVRLIPD